MANMNKTDGCWLPSMNCVFSLDRSQEESTAVPWSKVMWPIVTCFCGKVIPHYPKKQVYIIGIHFTCTVRHGPWPYYGISTCCVSLTRLAGYGQIQDEHLQTGPCCFSDFIVQYIQIYSICLFFWGVLGGGRSSILPCEGKIGKPNKDSRLDFSGEQLRSTSKYAPNMLLRTWAASGLLSLPQLVWLGILSFPSVVSYIQLLFVESWLAAWKLDHHFGGFEESVNSCRTLMMMAHCCCIELNCILSILMDVIGHCWVMSGFPCFVARWYYYSQARFTIRRTQFQHLSKGHFIGKPFI